MCVCGCGCAGHPLHIGILSCVHWKKNICVLNHSRVYFKESVKIFFLPFLLIYLKTRFFLTKNYLPTVRILPIYFLHDTVIVQLQNNSKSFILIPKWPGTILLKSLSCNISGTMQIWSTITVSYSHNSGLTNPLNWLLCSSEKVSSRNPV